MANTTKHRSRLQMVEPTNETDMSINGKVALVTGAGQGIGRAIALRLANDGAEGNLTDDATKEFIRQLLQNLMEWTRRIGQPLT